MAHQTTGRRLRGLCQLLLDLYDDADEFRRLLLLTLGRVGRSVVQEIPGAGASTASTISEAVLALERRGLITDEFFDVLVSERPQRVNDIRRVQGAL